MPISYILLISFNYHAFILTSSPFTTLKKNFLTFSLSLFYVHCREGGEDEEGWLVGRRGWRGGVGQRGGTGEATERAAGLWGCIGGGATRASWVKWRRRAQVADGGSGQRRWPLVHPLSALPSPSMDWSRLGGGGEKNWMGMPVVGWRKDLSRIAHVISLHAWMAYPLELHFLSPHAISWMEDMIERNKRRENVYVIFRTHTFRLQKLF